MNGPIAGEKVWITTAVDAVEVFRFGNLSEAEQLAEQLIESGEVAEVEIAECYVQAVHIRTAASIEAGRAAEELRIAASAAAAEEAREARNAKRAEAGLDPEEEQ